MREMLQAALKIDPEWMSHLLSKTWQDWFASQSHHCLLASWRHCQGKSQGQTGYRCRWESLLGQASAAELAWTLTTAPYHFPTHTGKLMIGLRGHFQLVLTQWGKYRLEPWHWLSPGWQATYWHATQGHINHTCCYFPSITGQFN